MIYGGYLQTVADRFDHLFTAISAEHNFDYGHEFEISLCKALRGVLPHRFGICRGFVVSAEGQTVGDDIIIFNRDRFGTLRLLEQDTFAQKEKIPLETVCAYLEAKHTLAIQGSGPQSLSKALDQIASVSNLLREPVPLAQISHHVKLPVWITRPSDWPQIHNPLYRAVWSRQVRIDEKSPPTDDKDSVQRALRESPAGCDLVVAGASFVGLPVTRRSATQSYSELSSPFFLPGISSFAHSYVPKLAYAVGVLHLLWALDTMQMGRMPWQSLVGDAFRAYEESETTTS